MGQTMPIEASGRIRQIRKFTNNVVYRYTRDSLDLFCKVVADANDARAEVVGYDVASRYYRVPVRHSVSQDRKGRTVLCYDYVPTVGRDSGLLADLIAESEEGSLRALDEYAAHLSTAYLQAMTCTARRLPKDKIQTKLFEDRIKPFGRIDQYYGDLGLCVTTSEEELICIRTFGEGILRANGVPHRFEWTSALSELRQYFSGPQDTLAVVTQGDPTELNLGVPLIWFDFDNAGYNAVVAEWATFLWYVYVQGGYLVPSYAPRLFRDHPGVLSLVGNRSTRVRSTRNGKEITVDYEMDIGRARRLLLSRYRSLLIEPVIDALEMADWEDAIRYYFALRIIGVYNIFELKGEDTWFMLAKLAECMDRDQFRLERFLGME